MGTGAPANPFAFPEADIDMDAIERQDVNDRSECGAYTITRTYDQLRNIFVVRIAGPASAVFEYANASDSIDAYNQAVRSIRVDAEIAANPNVEVIGKPADLAKLLMEQVADSIGYVLSRRQRR